MARRDLELTDCREGRRCVGRSLALLLCVVPWLGTVAAGTPSGGAEVPAARVTRGRTQADIDSWLAQERHAGGVTEDGRLVVFSAVRKAGLRGGAGMLRSVYLCDVKTKRVRRVTRAWKGRGQPNGPSEAGGISDDGLVVAFESMASNLVESDENSVHDVFVKRRGERGIRRVSVGTGGVEADAGCHLMGNGRFLTADGGHIVFESAATNLAGELPSGVTQIYVADTLAGGVTLVSCSIGGVPGDFGSHSPAISPDGRYVVFQSAATNLVEALGAPDQHVYVKDRLTGEVVIASVNSSGHNADDWSGAPSISLDGRRVCFISAATNLVDDDSNGEPDAFVRDIGTGLTLRVSVAPDASEWPHATWDAMIDGSGELVVWGSEDGVAAVPGSSGAAGVFAMDLEGGQARRITCAWDGGEADGGAWLARGGLSVGGEWCVVQSSATNIVRRDPHTRTLELFRFNLGGR